jgi:hypothetical protein
MQGVRDHTGGGAVRWRVPHASRSWSISLAALGAATAFGVAIPAGAVGIGAGTHALVVREEIYLVVHDPGSRRQHLLYAARVEPSEAGEAPAHALLALPTPAAPDIEVLAGIDLGAALHTISATHESLTGGRAPAPPASWSPRGVSAAARAIDLATPLTAPLPLDPEWLRSYTDAGSWLAALDVTAPGGRVEIQTPTVRISFASEHAVASLREPAHARPAPPAAEGQPDKAGDPPVAAPYLVSDVKTEPGDVAPGAEVVARVLRTQTAATRACYDALLEQRAAPGSGPESPEGWPSGSTSVDLAVTLGRRGDIRALDARSGPQDALGRCIAAAVRAKGFPRVDAEWRFTARITFEPPRTRSRRTHILLLSAERGRWFDPDGSKGSAGAGQDPPPPWKLVRAIEPTWEDIEAALPAEVRAKIGLTRRAGRLWAAQYVDQSTDRRGRPDRIWKGTSPLPAPGEPGTHAFAEERARARTAPPETARAAPTRGWLAGSPRRARTLGAAAVAAAVVLLALAMNRAR